MADEGNANNDVSEKSTDVNRKLNGSSSTSQPKRGFISSVWHRIFGKSDDFEKRLQHLSKEEASVHSRMMRRAHSWRHLARNLIIYGVVLEVAAVVYAIATTRSPDLSWQMRGIRVLPMFVVPGLCSAIYSALASYMKMRDTRDQSTLERLRTERQAKINELKERTNYYITQQLIQRYDPDPAAKAAAASVLASKLGAESGLKFVVGAEPGVPVGRSSDVEIVPPNNLRNRKSSHLTNSDGGSIITHETYEETPTDSGVGHQQASYDPPPTVTVSHHERSTANEGGWIARIAAMLVGEDPTQCYALICGNCHMHNGLVRKEDFPYITYYCPHCHALNQSQVQQENAPPPPESNSGHIGPTPPPHSVPISSNASGTMPRDADGGSASAPEITETSQSSEPLPVA